MGLACKSRTCKPNNQKGCYQIEAIQRLHSKTPPPPKKAKQLLWTHTQIHTQEKKKRKKVFAFGSLENFLHMAEKRVP